jgi:TPP-dependent pyruvate/acetoin dehydrogenase alpha subunit
MLESHSSGNKAESLNERLYQLMYQIRRVEEIIAEVYPTDKIKSPVHLSIGQEAVSAGVCAALQATDVVFGTYRGHALYLAKGACLKRMIAELYGKATGCAKGKGGSMHLVDVSQGVMGTSAVVGTTIPNAVGNALAFKYQNKQDLVVSFFGDGAVEEGVFWESLNFAVLQKLPILFVCENNQYAIHSAQKSRQGVVDICAKVESFGLPVTRIFDNDIFEIYNYTQSATTQIRQDRCGPMFVECMTYRWLEHVGPGEDFDLGYRPKEESKPWIENDQLIRLAELLNPEVCKKIEHVADEEIREAFDFAENSNFPEDAELFHDVYKVG